MPQTKIFSLALYAALLAFGCGKDGPPVGVTPAQVAHAAALRKVAEDQSEEVAKEKVTYTRAMQKRLNEMEPRYAELKTRAGAAEGQAKNDMQKKIDVVKTRRDEASRKLDDLKHHGSDGWQKAKEAFETALANLTREIE